MAEKNDELQSNQEESEAIRTINVTLESISDSLNRLNLKLDIVDGNTRQVAQRVSVLEGQNFRLPPPNARVEHQEADQQHWNNYT